MGVTEFNADIHHSDYGKVHPAGVGVEGDDKIAMGMEGRQEEK